MPKKKLRTNVDRVVMLSVQGKVSYPSGRRNHSVDADGRVFLLPSIGDSLQRQGRRPGVSSTADARLSK